MNIVFNRKQNYLKKLISTLAFTPTASVTSTTSMVTFVTSVFILSHFHYFEGIIQMVRLLLPLQNSEINLGLFDFEFFGFNQFFFDFCCQINGCIFLYEPNVARSLSPFKLHKCKGFVIDFELFLEGFFNVLPFR